MCGYVFNLSVDRINTNKLKNSLNSIKYRGPDETKIEEGQTLKKSNYFLGFNRLAIYDLNSASMQPFKKSDNDWSLLFNGSIYNFKEIKEKLIIKGYKFQTSGDTEVVFVSFIEYGENCFKLFNGMWSIIFFNKSSGEIIMSRDRLGIKPLYYNISDKEVFIASEPICFLKKSSIFFEENNNQIKKFIYCGLHDDDEYTFYKNIKQVKPNTVMKFDFDRKKISEKNYDDWKVDNSNFDLGQRIKNSVKLRLFSDVSNFSLLSGGLDSSLIAKIIAQNKTNDFKGFITHAPIDKNEYDESEYAKEIFKSFKSNIEHHLIKKEDNLDLKKIINLTKIQQEPFLNPSIFAHYEVFEWVRNKKIRVLITGEGADEVFGGYSKVYQPTYFLTALKKFDIKLLFKILFEKNTSIFRLLKKTSFLLPDYINIALLKILRSKNNLLKNEFNYDQKSPFKNWITQQKLSLEERLNFDILNTNLPHVLRNAERNSMSNSIELRHPYLDYNVIKFAMRMNIKERSGIIGKKALRMISKEYGIPFHDKPKSVGFGNTYEFNFNSKDLNDYILDNSKFWNEICSRDKLEKNLNKKNNSLEWWRSISLILWLIYKGERKREIV